MQDKSTCNVLCPVTGQTLKNIDFEVNNCGFVPELYEAYYQKSPFEFYTLFFWDDVVNLICSK